MVNNLSKAAYFQKKKLIRPSFFQGLVGRMPKENVVVVLHNMVCSTAVTNISQHNVQDVLSRYRANLRKEPHLTGVKGIYKQFIRFVLADKRVSNLELKKLLHLKDLLMLRANEAKLLYEEVVVALYEKTLQDMLQDHQLDEEEKTTLRKLREALQIPDECIEKAHTAAYRDTLHGLIAGFVEDERISDEEVQEMETLVASLGIKADISEPTFAQLSRYRLYWQIENNPLPALAVDIRLQRGESCHFAVPCTWQEYKTVTRGVGFGGPVLQFKVVRGMYWRRGHYQINRVRADVLRTIDEGEVYITTKRILFVGKKNTRSLRMAQIVDFEPHQNGVELKRATGKAIFLAFEGVTDLFGMVLGRCLHEQ